MSNSSIDEYYQLARSHGALRVRQRVEESDAEPRRAVEEAELQHVRAQELERGAHEQAEEPAAP